MCFFQKLTIEPQQIEKLFNAQFNFFKDYKPKTIISGFDFPKTPVIKHTNRFSIEMLQWGLIPHWANKDWNKAFTLNARYETLKEKPAFKHIINNRCLIITNGFYEWQHNGNLKTKFEIGFENHLFAFAGLYDQNNQHESYTIVTTEAVGIMHDIHNTKHRMPIALKTSEEMNDWLNGKEVTGRSDFTAINLDPIQLNLF